MRVPPVVRADRRAIDIRADTPERDFATLDRAPGRMSKIRSPHPSKGTTMRKLTLKKETLAELSTAELTSVVGAGATLAGVCTSPTLTLTCWSEIDGCLTAQICG